MMNFMEDDPKTIVPYMANNAIIERKDPYGLYAIRLERGPAPQEFEGMFTSIGLAIARIKETEKDRMKNRAKEK